MTENAKLTLYPEMNREIVKILRLSPQDNPTSEYAAQLIEEQARKIETLERALNGRCWACDKSIPWDKQPKRYPAILRCKHSKYVGSGNVRNCDNWHFDEARFMGGSEEE